MRYSFSMKRTTVVLMCVMAALWQGISVAYESGSPEALLASGNSLIRSGQYDQAIEVLSKADTLVYSGDPAQQAIRLARANAYYRKEDVEQALGDAEYVTNMDPSNEQAKAWTLMLRGLLALREANTNDSLRLLTGAIKASHDDVNLRAECFMNRGQALLGANRAEEALSDLTKALELNPGLDQVRELKKRASLLRDEVTKARQDSNEALATRGQNDTPTASQRTSHAEASASRPMAPVGRNAQELMKNGGWFLSQGNYDQAIENYTAALDLLNPSDRNVPAARIARAIAYAGKGDVPNAWNDATFVIQSGNGDYKNVVLALHFRGKMSARQRKFDKALEDYTQAIQTPHGDRKLRSRSFTERALMFMDFGQPEKAVTDLDNAITWNLESGHAYLTRCKAYLEMGESGKSRSDCQMALQKGLSGASAQEAKDLLNELSVGPAGPKTVRIPMDQRGHMHVQVRFSARGRPHRFLLDTGATVCLIDKGLLERIKKETRVTEAGKGIAITADGTRRPCTVYHVGQAFLYDLPLGATEVHVYDEPMGRIGNLFGVGAMKNLSVKIDNVKREAEITLLK